MENIFITQIDINQIRHLQGINIPLSDKERKHLILTGKNGSGKTSVLEVLRDYFQKFHDPNIQMTTDGGSRDFPRSLDEVALKYKEQITYSFNEDPTEMIHLGKFITVYFECQK